MAKKSRPSRKRKTPKRKTPKRKTPKAKPTKLEKAFAKAKTSAQRDITGLVVKDTRRGGYKKAKEDDQRLARNRIGKAGLVGQLENTPLQQIAREFAFNEGRRGDQILTGRGRYNVGTGVGVGGKTPTGYTGLIGGYGLGEERFGSQSQTPGQGYYEKEKLRKEYEKLKEGFMINEKGEEVEVKPGPYKVSRRIMVDGKYVKYDHKKHKDLFKPTSVEDKHRKKLEEMGYDKERIDLIMSHPVLHKYMEEAVRPVKTTAESQWDLDHPKWNEPVPLEKFLSRTPPSPKKEKGKSGQKVSARTPSEPALTTGPITTSTVTTLEDIQERPQPVLTLRQGLSSLRGGHRLGGVGGVHHTREEGARAPAPAPEPEPEKSRWERFEEAGFSAKDFLKTKPEMSAKQIAMMNELSSDENIKLGNIVEAIKFETTATQDDMADYFKEYPVFDIKGGRYIDNILREETEDILKHQRQVERTKGGIKSRTEALRKVGRPGPETLIVRQANQASSNKIEDELKKINKNLWERHTQQGLKGGLNLHYNQFTKQEKLDYENATKRASRVPSLWEQTRRPIIKQVGKKETLAGAHPRTGERMERHPQAIRGWQPEWEEKRFKTKKSDIDVLEKTEAELDKADARRLLGKVKGKMKEERSKAEYYGYRERERKHHDRPELAEFRTDLSREVKEEKKKEALDKRGIFKFTGKVGKTTAPLDPKRWGEERVKEAKRIGELEARPKPSPARELAEQYFGPGDRYKRYGVLEKAKQQQEQQKALHQIYEGSSEKGKRLFSKDIKEKLKETDPPIPFDEYLKTLKPKFKEPQQTKRTPQPEPEPEQKIPPGPTKEDVARTQEEVRKRSKLRRGIKEVQVAPAIAVKQLRQEIVESERTEDQLRKQIEDIESSNVLGLEDDPSELRKQIRDRPKRFATREAWKYLGGRAIKHSQEHDEPDTPEEKQDKEDFLAGIEEDPEPPLPVADIQDFRLARGPLAGEGFRKKRTAPEQQLHLKLAEEVGGEQLQEVLQQDIKQQQQEADKNPYRSRKERPVSEFFTTERKTKLKEEESELNQLINNFKAKYSGIKQKHFKDIMKAKTHSNIQTNILAELQSRGLGGQELVKVQDELRSIFTTAGGVHRGRRRTPKRRGRPPKK